MATHLNLRELIQNDWKNILKSCFEQEWMIHLESQLAQEYAEQQVFPCVTDIFNGLNFADFK